jgi:hypothetical protein
LNLLHSLNDLGLFALDETVKKFKSASLLFDEETSIPNQGEFLKMTDDLKVYLTDLVKTNNLILNEENYSYFLTSKVKCIINILLKLNLNSEQFHAIIFVEKRDTAFLLDCLLKKLVSFSKFSEQLKFIKSDYIVGHENDNHARMTIKDQVTENWS